MTGWSGGRERRSPSRGSGRRSRPAAETLTDGTREEPPGPAEHDLGDPESVARAICLRALTGTPKTRQQLAELLGRKGVPDDAAEAVLDRFGEVGLIDDAAFARAWVSSRQAGRGLARRALRAELRAKGVDPDTAEQAVGLVDDDDERDAARRLVERRLAGMRRLDRTTATRRLIGMLARKGYSGGLASAVVREALDGAQDAAEDDADDLADDLGSLDEDALQP
jgi:regulatory protein